MLLRRNVLRVKPGHLTDDQQLVLGSLVYGNRESGASPRGREVVYKIDECFLHIRPLA